MRECGLFALVLGLSVVLLTGLQDVRDSIILSWRWHTLATLPGASACLPFQLLHLTWALTGLLLCGCPVWRSWYMVNRGPIATMLLLMGWLFEAGYFWQTKDALSVMVCRALVFPVAISLCTPGSLRLRSSLQGWGLVLGVLGVFQQFEAAEVAPFLTACLLVAHTSAACLAFLGQAASFAKGVPGLKLTEGKAMAEGTITVGNSHSQLKFKLEIEQEPNDRGKDREKEGLADKERQVTLVSQNRVHDLRGASTSGQEQLFGTGEAKLGGDELEEGETEEDDFEERILELASVPGAVQDRSETVFTGRPNASAALLESAPSSAVASLLRKPSSSQGGPSSSGEATPQNERASFVLTNEERMATTTSRLRALAGAASGKSPRGGVQQSSSLRGGAKHTPTRIPPGKKLAPDTRSPVTPSRPKSSLSGALPVAAVAVSGARDSDPSLSERGLPLKGGLTIGKRVANESGSGGLSATGVNASWKDKGKAVEPPTPSRKGKEKVVEDETPKTASEKVLAATYAAVAAARAAEALGAARPWGMGAGSPSTELDYRTAGGNDWRSPAWKGLGEEWLMWMQDMFFKGPGWDGGISRTDEEREAQRAREQDGEGNESDSDDDESYDFAKMEEKYKGLLGSMRGFGGSAPVAADVSKESEEESEEDDDDWEEEGLAESPGSAPNPWAIDLEQQKGWLKMIAEAKLPLPSVQQAAYPVLEASAYTLNASLPLTDSAQSPPVAAPRFVLDASSPVLRVEEPLGVAEPIATAPHFVLNANSPVLRVKEPGGLSVAKPTVQLDFSSPPAMSAGPGGDPFSGGFPNPPAMLAPGGGPFSDPQMARSLAHELQRDSLHLQHLGKQCLVAKQEEDIQSASDKIAQRLAAPAFTLDASIAAAGSDELSPEDVVHTSERITQLLAAPTFTLDASVAALPVKNPPGNSTPNPPNAFKSAEEMRLDPEQLIHGSSGPHSEGEGEQALHSGGSSRSDAEALDPQDPSFRSGFRGALNTYPNSEGDLSGDAPSKSLVGGGLGTMGGDKVVGDTGGPVATASALAEQAPAVTSGMVFTPAFTLNASRHSAMESTPLFTLDATRPPTVESAPLFTLDATRPPTVESAPLFTLDASRPAGAEIASRGNGKDASDGYAWTQMSERLARRSNGRGMSKVDQEWLKVMERVKDKLPQMQADWKPELHIPFVALGN